MNDIAKQLGFTKAALYKHYTSKQEIWDRIVERMNEMDYERAKQFEMPEGNLTEIVAAYQKTPIEKVRAYSKAQFLHWTEEEFSYGRYEELLGQMKKAKISAKVVYLFSAKKFDAKTRQLAEEQKEIVLVDMTEL